MGILDDAIREHLDLKRKHGVSEEEVQRQQEEALGPARREAAEQSQDPEGGAEKTIAPVAEAAADGDPAVDGDVLPFDAEHPQTPSAETLPAEPVPDEPPAAMPPPEPEPEPEPEPAEAPQAAEPFVASEPADVRLGDTEPHGFPAVGEKGAEPAPPDVEPPDSDPDSEPEDVLEDTPDFLQETPEHDRLWFEQKPPRDFDFD